LRAIRGDIAKLSTRLDNLTAEMRTSNGHLASVIHSDLHKSGRIAEPEARLDRIERRLEIVS
jgi:tetrahydromethanopterin S-methyltransferase subunit G